MAKAPDPEKKKSYSTPRLKVYGTIRELTKTGNLTANPDGGTRGSHRFTAQHGKA